MTKDKDKGIKQVHEPSKDRIAKDLLKHHDANERYRILSAKELEKLHGDDPDSPSLFNVTVIVILFLLILALALFLIGQSLFDTGDSLTDQIDETVALIL